MKNTANLFACIYKSRIFLHERNQKIFLIIMLIITRFAKWYTARIKCLNSTQIICFIFKNIISLEELVVRNYSFWVSITMFASFQLTASKLYDARNAQHVIKKECMINCWDNSESFLLVLAHLGHLNISNGKYFPFQKCFRVC